MIVHISVRKYVKAYIHRVYGTEIRAKGNDEFSQEMEMFMAAALATSTINTNVDEEVSVRIAILPRLAKIYQAHEQHFIKFDTFFLRNFDHAMFNFIIGQYLVFGEIHKSLLAFYELYGIDEDDLPAEIAEKRFQRFCENNTSARLLWEDINRIYKHNHSRLPKRRFDNKVTGSYLLLQ